jgi:peptidoglycan LD-endopeptidase LytH
MVDGIWVYSLYAHLQEIRSDLKVGKQVRAGEQIAVMGRTSNTAQRITQDRAHVHFEFDLFYNDNFPSWFKKYCAGERNDHGQWNGMNLAGIDPRLIFLEERRLGAQFNLVTWLSQRTELCRVMVRQKDFPWVRHYPALVARNPKAEREGIAGYEISLDYNAIPFRLIPRAASEIKGSGKYQLLSVNEAEYTKNPCRRLVVRKGTSWQLGPHGVKFLDLLTWK